MTEQSSGGVPGPWFHSRETAAVWGCVAGGGSRAPVLQSAMGSSRPAFTWARLRSLSQACASGMGCHPGHGAPCSCCCARGQGHSSRLLPALASLFLQGWAWGQAFRDARAPERPFSCSPLLKLLNHQGTFGNLGPLPGRLPILTWRAGHPLPPTRKPQNCGGGDVYLIWGWVLLSLSVCTGC